MARDERVTLLHPCDCDIRASRHVLCRSAHLQHGRVQAVDSTLAAMLMGERQLHLQVAPAALKTIDDLIHGGVIAAGAWKQLHLYTLVA